ncbi:MAG: hypothetical protein OEU32_10160 [Acidimicrobiia bacterium]|nr:hypothetical protein [Acidimicrobiia bacterium]
MTATLVAARLERDVVIARGPGTADYLQGQLAQDVAALGDGDSAWSLLLEPQGKMVAVLRITRATVDEYLLDVDTGWADAVVARLERFKLRTACDFTAVRWPAISYRGPGAEAVEADAPIVAAAAWAGVEGVDVVGPDVAGLEVVAGAELVTAGQFDLLRIGAGWPAMGAEIDASTIPAASGVVDIAASFTKGCYTGQELVARIDSRGNNTPTRLVGLRAAPGTPVVAGAPVTVGGEPAGTVTSVATDSDGSVAALVYLRRAHEAAGVGEVGAEPGPATVELLELPVRP